MPDSRQLPDPPLTAEQRARASALSEAELQSIDQALLRQVSEDWRKIARVVGFAMGEPSVRSRGLPDIFYAERVRHLVAAGVLEAAGDVRAMGLGEVRFPGGKRHAV